MMGSQAAWMALAFPAPSNASCATHIAAYYVIHHLLAERRKLFVYSIKKSHDVTTNDCSIFLDGCAIVILLAECCGYI